MEKSLQGSTPCALRIVPFLIGALEKRHILSLGSHSVTPSRGGCDVIYCKARDAAIRKALFGRRTLRLAPPEHAFQVSEQLDRHAVPLHDHALLEHRQGVVPR